MARHTHLFTVVAAACLLLAASPVSAEDDVILNATKSGGPHVGLIIVQGAGIPADRYIPLAQALQATFPSPLWIGIPAYPLDTPEPLVIGQGISRVTSKMYAAGMSDTAAFFYGGHSLGGAMLQMYMMDNLHNATGQILMGAFITRSDRNHTGGYPVSTLTIGGELDGLCRVTRIAEAYYHSVLIAPDHAQAVKDFPVVINLGQSHMQFASGTPPPLVKARDLKPEITYAEAHKLAAEHASNYMQVRMGISGAPLTALTAAVDAAGSFCKPITDAMVMEGSYHIKPPCYSNPRSDKCLYGSPWTIYAQKMMGGLTDITYTVTNSFHPVWKIPFHLPHIYNNCTAPTPACNLNITTVAQNVYEELDKLDTGFTYVSAHEIRAKMKSRQAVEVAAGITNANFNQTDGASLCARINDLAYQYALKNAGSRTAQRFAKLGQPMVMGPDIGPLNIGPLWIWTALKYTNETESTGSVVLNITSPMLRTPVNYWLQLAAGYHYCKLLSPSRAIEWMYVDGLRWHDSLTSGTNDEVWMPQWGPSDAEAAEGSEAALAAAASGRDDAW